MFVVPHAFLGNDEQVVIAHEIGLYPVFDPLVVIDVGPACVTAVEYDHYDAFHFIANKFDELLQVALFVFG